MKFGVGDDGVGHKSHPARGGWIEIYPVHIPGKTRRGPTPHGVGGLKYLTHDVDDAGVSPTPHGVGGLKLLFVSLVLSSTLSHPARGGWIEIS